MPPEATIEDIASIKVRHGPRKISLLTRVDDYARRVLKFQDELAGDGTGRYDWGMIDFIGLLELRSTIDHGLNRGSDPLESPIVRAIDQLLISFTTHVDQWAHQLDPELPASPWWWSRIPSQGLVALDYAAARRRLAP